MKTTSHFVWIELLSKIFSNVFIEVYKYLKFNNIENIVSFQNILSIHITLYYFEQKISSKDEENIYNKIANIELNEQIFADWFNYFFRNHDEYICYFNIKTSLNLKKHRDDFHKIFNRNWVIDNNCDFVPHISFFKILDYKIYKKHKANIENILKEEILKINNINVNSHKIFLYSVNSEFGEEIQIKNS